MGVVKGAPRPRKTPPPKATKRTPTTGKGSGGIRTEGSSDIHHDVTLIDATVFCYERRIAGESYKSISDRSLAVVGRHISISGVQKIIDTFIEARVMPTVEKYRAVELDRLEKYLLKLESRIDDGDDKALGIAIKISERMSKLVGMDAPVKVDATFTPTALPESVGALVQVARERAAELALSQGEMPPDLLESEDGEAEMEAFDNMVIDAEVIEDAKVTMLRLMNGGQ